MLRRRLLLAVFCTFASFVPPAQAALAANVLPPAHAPRAVASPPSALRPAATARAPRGVMRPTGNVLAPLRAPLTRSSPPPLLRRSAGTGYAVGTRAQTAAQGSSRLLSPPIARRTAAASATTLLSESFTGVATTAGAWTSGDNACITAGSSLSTPGTSLPACGANAPQDPAGGGALELTPPINNEDGFALSTAALPASGGLSISFNEYSFGVNGATGDGVAVVLTDAAQPLPTHIGGCCGSLGYAPYYGGGTSLAGGYLAVGLDETGYFSAANEGKTGGLGSLVPNTITVRGAAQVNAPYLFGALNSAGQAASLPFALSSPAAKTRPAGVAVTVTLTPGGLLSVSIDRHDGNGSVMYIPPTAVAGLNGQPALPAAFHLGFLSAGGGANARHQISNVVVTTTAVATQPVSAETFTGNATTPNGWSAGDRACLTAGSSATPASSIPACGTNAAQDAVGAGALQLTPPVNNTDGFAFDRTAFATSGGLSITFNDYAFNTSSVLGDGIAVVLTDAAGPVPTHIGGCCGSLGYAPYENTGAALPNGYLGIGFDQTGYFNAADEGKTGGLGTLLANTIGVRGATSLGAPYLFGLKNTSGAPAALPFLLGVPAATTRPAGLTINVTLTANGLLSAAIDRHDGAGLVTYLPPTPVVGVNGQPAVPANVYVGFIAASGGANARHQINNVSIAAAPAPVASTISVLTYHNDVNRTGWNPAETTLTTANVNSSSFGLLHTVALDGRVDAQPLIVANQSIDGQGTHDVVYVATENNSVYAADARSGALLKARNLGTSIPNSAKDYDDNVYPVYGIASTPVIDRANNAIYVVTDTNEGASAPDVYRIHKLALNNFADLVPSTVIAPATVLSDGSTYLFPAKHERQRPGLLEAGGVVYVAFGSTGDTQPTISRGVIAGFSAANLAPLNANLYADRIKATANPYYLSSIWQSGYAPAADAQGNVYFTTGNSSPNSPSYGPPYNYPDSVLKVSANLSTVLGSFTQFDYFNQDRGDNDFGAGGAMLLPDQSGSHPHLLVAGGKNGKAFVLDRDNLGGFTPNGPNKDLAELNVGGCWCGPAYFKGSDGVARIVTGGGNGVTTWKVTTAASVSFALEGQVSAANTNGQPDNGGTIPVVSSNGTVPGSAILWFVQRPNDTSSFTLHLRAYDASNLSRALYSSAAGSWSNQNSNANVVPTVANGYVYVASNRQLQIFGLLGH